MGRKEKTLLIIVAILAGLILVAKGWGIPTAMGGYVLYKLYIRWRRGGGSGWL